METPSLSVDQDTASGLDENDCWKAVRARDASRDGTFYYGVSTTGVYCRPSCQTPRQALRKNMRFFETAQAAEQAGLRACKRCRPQTDEQHKLDTPIQKLRQFIDQHANESLSLARLGKQVNLSPQYLQRRFKAQLGVSPRQYQESVRLRNLKRALQNGKNATTAIYDSGFGSPSRVYEKVASHLGMTPGQYRAGGRGLCISYATANTSIGLLMLAATDRGLCFVQLGDSTEQLQSQLEAEYPHALFAPMKRQMKSDLDNWMAALSRHLDGDSRLPDVPMDVRGTAFQIKVWRYLQTIPYGQVQSYTEVAKGIGRPTAVRAVASACARNRLALLIPCHRVIRGDGTLGGYRWGLERKRALIDLERQTAAWAAEESRIARPKAALRR